MLPAYLAATAFARPTFNVRDYGAVGDNATDDKSARLFIAALQRRWQSGLPPL